MSSSIERGSVFRLSKVKLSTENARRFSKWSCPEFYADSDWDNFEAALELLESATNFFRNTAKSSARAHSHNGFVISADVILRPAEPKSGLKVSGRSHVGVNLVGRNQWHHTGYLVPRVKTILFEGHRSQQLKVISAERQESTTTHCPAQMVLGSRSNYCETENSACSQAQRSFLGWGAPAHRLLIILTKT